MREPIITAYDMNDGEVTPVWRYKLESKVSPGADGSDHDIVQEGNISLERLAEIKADLQEDLDYWSNVETLLTTKIEETENGNSSAT